MSSWTDKKGRLHVGVMVKGERLHRILQVGATASDAKLTEAQLRGAIDKSPKGKPINIPGDPMLTEIMAIYCEHADSLRSPDTAKHHANRLGPWAAKYRASEAKAATRHFVKDCKPKYAAATINWSLSCLKKGLEIAFDNEITPVNYSDQVKTLPVHNIREASLTVEQITKLSACCSENVRAVMWIALYTGCRRGEILKMTKEDVGPDSILIRSGNTKTLKTRTIPIVSALRPWLAYIPIPINGEGVKSGWGRAVEKAGMPQFIFKDLRRSCATLMIEAGVELYVVSQLLGHSSTVVTQQRYGHLRIARIADGLDRTFK